MLPPGVRFVSSTSGCTASPGPGDTQIVECPLSSIAPGSSQRVAFTVRVLPGVAPGTGLTLTATLTSIFDSTPDDNVSTLGSPSPPRSRPPAPVKRSTPWGWSSWRPVP